MEICPAGVAQHLAFPYLPALPLRVLSSSGLCFLAAKQSAKTVLSLVASPTSSRLPLVSLASPPLNLPSVASLPFSPVSGRPPLRGPPLSPVSPTAATASREQQEAARAALAAALLGHDASAEPLRDPSLPIHSSALLAPFRHLLDVRPPSPPAPLTPTSLDSVERVEGEQEVEADGAQPGGVRSGATAAGGLETSESGGGAESGNMGRRNSFVSSMLWSMAGGKSRKREKPPSLDLNPDEEERLVDEWGLDAAMSSAASAFEEGGHGEGRSSPTWQMGVEGAGMAGVGLRRVPQATAMSEAGLLSQERKKEALAEAAADDDIELLETRSAPDLDRSHNVSFADAVLTGLDQRLKERAAVKAMTGSASVGDETENSKDDALSEGHAPRIKIIERTPAQRRERARTQSLGPALGLADLPTFSDLAAVADGSSTTSGAGIASRDSLFVGARTRAARSVGMASGMSSGWPRSTGGAASVPLSSRRGSFDALSTADTAADRLTSRLSIAIPSVRSSGPRSPVSPTTPISPSSAFPPRPSSATSLTTPIEPTTPGFTSRFDPIVIAAQRAEVLKERPQFSNPDGGKPPKVVLMPAPLAGRPPSPVRKPRVEGPSSEGEESEEEPEPEPEEEEKDERPAGALYGRSLMDVMAERKAIQRGKQKAYVPGSDGRRQMFEYQAPALSTSTSSAAAGALAKLEGVADDDGNVEDREDDVPLALVPAGGALKRQQQERERDRKRQALGRIAQSKSTVSIFGPDLIYQREAAAAREAEEAERKEREAKEARDREKEEKRRSKAKLRRKSLGPQALPAMETTAERERRERGEPQAVEVLNDVHARQPSPAGQRAHAFAPSLSIPAGLDANALSQSASGAFGADAESWFRPPSPPVKLTNDSEDEDDDAEEAYRPRPISALALNAAGGAGRRKSTGFISESESEDESGTEDGQEQIRAVPAAAPRTSRLSLPLPGEPSSPGHSPTAARPAADLSLGSSPHLSPTISRALPFPGEASSVGHGASVADTDEEPLGRRYSRQSLMLMQDGAAEEDEDEAPLGRRYSIGGRSLMDILPDVDFEGAGEGERLGLEFGGEEQAEEGEEDEDDKPLGARFSVLPTPLAAGEDEDDVPLAIHRLSLAPNAAFDAYSGGQQQPQGTLHALDDDGKTVKSVDSDDKPLGLKAGGGAPPAMPAMAQFPQAASGFFPPPFPPAFAAPYGMPSAFPSQPFLPMAAPGFPVLPQQQQPGAMELALAQMQLHAAAMQQQAAFQAGGMQGVPVGGVVGAPPQGESIERWRRGVV